MKQLQMGIKEFPDIFVCQNDKDIELAKANGLPYIIWKTNNYDKLIKLVLYHLVCKMMPEIDWAKLWGISRQDLEFCENGSVCIETAEGYHEYNIDDYLVSNDARVNIEELEALHLLPAFLGEITDVIRRNITDYTWHDGVNKKTGLWMGNYLPQQELPNLIILDISRSIPVGISSVMLRLIDTIRHKCNAELIITGGTSYYWGINDALPDPQEIRDMIPRSNESPMFEKIIREKVAGRHWGHIISFGDGDRPALTYYWIQYSERYGWNYNTNERNVAFEALSGTDVDYVHHYHTREQKQTGYAWFFDMFNPKLTFNTSWCSCFKDRC